MFKHKTDKIDLLFIATTGQTQNKVGYPRTLSNTALENHQTTISYKNESKISWGFPITHFLFIGFKID